MGWNSWDSYGLTITEAQFRANVTVQAERLKPAGYLYAVVDEGWFLRNPQDRPTPEKLEFQLDGFGRYVPVPARFPSAGMEAASSFQALGEWVHAQGLKFGIHIVRGIPRESVKRNLPVAGSAFHAVDAADQTDACPWDPTNWGVRDDAAGQAWYDSLLRQYAGWGVDFLKVDCISSHPYKPGEIAMIRRAIDKTGRPMVLSLSPGPTALSDAAGVKAKAQMWRIADDMWDYWRTGKDYPHGVADMFAPAAAWALYAGPGNWPDADMLPLGHLGPEPGEGKARETRLTLEEQRTLMTLWAMAKSPLILGANLTQLDEATYKLVTNPRVIAADQQGHGERQVEDRDGVVVWRSDGAPGQSWLAVFNTSEAAVEVKRPLAELGLAAKNGYGLVDVWSGGSGRGSIREVEVQLAPHGCWMVELRESVSPAR
jgi:hypothetical protein